MKIVLYTDCFVFGGCEKPLFEVVTSSAFQDKYKIIYRHSGEYLRGLVQFKPAFPGHKLIGLRFPHFNTWEFFFERWIKDQILMKPVRCLLELAFYLFQPLLFAYELFVLYFVFLFNRADIIHINNGGYPGALSCRAAAIAARLSGQKKIVFSVNNTAVKTRGPLEKVIDLWVAKSVDQFVTGSKASGRVLAELRGFSAKKIINIYHGLEALDPQILPAALELGQGDKYLVMIARFEERKGQRFLIKAYQRLLADYSDIKLLLIGDGPQLEEIKNLAAVAGLGNNVIFAGHRSDYLSFLNGSVCLLNPSLGQEDLPLVILEAMSLGIPVIGTRVAGIPEEIEDGVTGLLIEPGKSEAILAALRMLFSDENKRRSMGVEGRQRFLAFFTREKMVDSYLRLYASLVDNSDRGVH